MNPVSLNFRADALSIFFLILISAVSLDVLLYTARYARTYRGRTTVTPLLVIFITSMLLVAAAADALTFLIFWEIMSLSSFLLVISEGKRELRKAGFLYFVTTHLGTALIIAAFYLLSIRSSSLDFASFSHTADWGVLVLALTGFAAKAGLIPVHVWLPHAHPVAPSNVSALMSGVMVKVPIYGMLRFLFCFSSLQSDWPGMVLLAAGAVSAVGGIMYALGQSDIKRLLAYSTIENVGIITMGIGTAYWASLHGLAAVASTAMIAALLHIFNHGMYKSALFMGAGLIHTGTHTYSMEQLGGLARRMPLFSLLFLAASMAIAALPPFNGFISEWYLYHALIALTRDGGLLAGYAAMGSLMLLALSGALAGACFVKVYGISFLGRPRSQRAAEARKPGFIETAAVALPVLASLAVGLYPTPWINLLSPLAATLTGSVVSGGPAPAFSLSLPGGFSSIAPLPVAAALVGMLLLLVPALKAAGKPVRYYETWSCGLTEENPRAQFSGGAFSAAIRRVFAMFYSVISVINFDKEVRKYFRQTMDYREQLADPFERTLYTPAGEFMKNLSKRFNAAVESGGVNRALSYIFLALLASLSALWVLL